MKSSSRTAWADDPHYVKNDNAGSADPIPQDSASFSQFVNDSTFHGVKYIFEDAHLCRRLLWFLCVIAAVIFFTVQVIIRTFDYFDYKSTVNFEVLYENEVHFPAVTLCNQNNFRISSTAELEQYNFIDAIFSTRNVSDIDVSLLNNTAFLNTSAFLMYTAHQKTDLIERCTWKKLDCNISSDFLTRITDLGVCFTFNVDGLRKLQESGSSAGLSLVLNVEQYEYMRGPQNDAGVKLLLHHHGEHPKMTDLGFAVAPGTHTLVAVETTHLFNLPHPYGNCHTEAEPITDCQVKCESSHVDKVCGCVHPYMTSLTGSHNPLECNMTDTFKCVSTALDSLHKQQDVCTCKVPCERTVYKAGLSYAQLSQFNIERLALTDQQRKLHIQENFLLARETSQRVISHIAENDQEQITRLSEYIRNIHDVFTQKEDLMINSTALASHFHVADIVQNGYKAFASDMELINNKLHEKHFTQMEALSADIENKIIGIQPVLDQMVGFLNLRPDNFNISETLIGILKKCIDNGMYSFCNNDKVNTENSIESEKYSLCGRKKRDVTTSPTTLDIPTPIDDQWFTDPWAEHIRASATVEQHVATPPTTSATVTPAYRQWFTNPWERHTSASTTVVLGTPQETTTPMTTSPISATIRRQSSSAVTITKPTASDELTQSPAHEQWFTDPWIQSITQETIQSTSYQSPTPLEPLPTWNRDENGEPPMLTLPYPTLASTPESMVHGTLMLDSTTKQLTASTQVSWATTTGFLGIDPTSTNADDQRLQSTSWFNPCVDYSAMHQEHKSLLNFRHPPMEWSWFSYSQVYWNYCNNKENYKECAFIGKPNLCYCPEYIWNKKDSLYSHENSYLYLGRSSGNPDDVFDKSETLQNLNEVEDKYQSHLDDLFRNSSVVVKDVIGYKACDEVLQNFNTDTMMVIHYIFGWFENMFDETYNYEVNVLYFDEFVEIVANMTNSVIDAGLAGGYKSLFETFQACLWPRKYSYYFTDEKTNAEEKAKFDTFANYGQNALKEYMSLKMLYNKMADSYLKLKNTFMSEISPQLEILGLYATKDITKKELADKLTSVALKHILETFNSMFDEFMIAANNLHNSLYSIHFQLKEAYSNLFSMIIPIMDDNILEITNVWQTLIALTDNPTMIELKLVYKENRKEIFNQMLDNMFADFLKYPEDVKSNLSLAVKGFKLAFDGLETDLNTYLDGSKMDSNFYMDNFLQVDIFFKELNYERIEQLKAFKIESLFGEVGGFMGLLLGASVLTMCELLDFLVRMIAGFCHRKKAVGTNEKLNLASI